MKQEQQGFSFIEILFSLCLLSLGIGSCGLVLMKCKVMGLENEWQGKTLMMAFGIREAMAIRDFRLDSLNSFDSLDSLDLKEWRAVLNEHFKGSSIEIECVRKEQEIAAKESGDSERECKSLNIVFIPPISDSDLLETTHSTNGCLKILKYRFAF